MVVRSHHKSTLMLGPAALPICPYTLSFDESSSICVQPTHEKVYAICQVSVCSVGLHCDEDNCILCLITYAAFPCLFSWYSLLYIYLQ